MDVYNAASNCMNFLFFSQKLQHDIQPDLLPPTGFSEYFSIDAHDSFQIFVKTGNNMSLLWQVCKERLQELELYLLKNLLNEFCLHRSP